MLTSSATDPHPRVQMEVVDAVAHVVAPDMALVRRRQPDRREPGAGKVIGRWEGLSLHWDIRALDAEVVAQCALDGLRDGRFLILPHEEVLTFWQRKTADVDRWLRGMRRLRAKVMGTA